MIDIRFYELIAHLWRGGKYSLFWTSDDGQGEKLSHWLTLPTTDEVPKYLLGLDAYFAVHPANIRRSQHERARIDDVIAVNCFY
jgi:hypothetical protein